jgi:hypothetical protein
VKHPEVVQQQDEPRVKLLDELRGAVGTKDVTAQRLGRVEREAARRDN